MKKDIFDKLEEAGIAIPSLREFRSARNKRVLRDYVRGDATADISLRYNISQNCICKLVVNSKVPSRPQGRPRLVDVKKVIKLTEKGLKGGQIAKQIGVSVAAVHRTQREVRSGRLF